MKIPTLVVSALLITTLSHGQLLTDHFDYPNANLGASGSGSAIWTDGNTPSSAITVNSSAALTYPGLFGVTGSGVIFSGGTFKKIAAPFASQTSGSVYVSFLINVQSPGNGAKLLVYLQNGNSASSSPPLGIYLDGSQLGLAKYASTPAVTAPALAAGTHLIVARYSFLAGNDRVDLWVDPTALGTNPIPTATLTTGTANSSDAPALSDIFLNHAVAQTVWFDELRVGSSWAEVTPTDVSTPPGVTGSPVFTAIANSPVGLVLQGTNGIPNGDYAVIAATNVALPLNQWVEVATKTFDASGNFIVTNPISPSAPQQFYRIRSGAGTPQPTAPGIVTQPQDRSVPAGQTAEFNVVASGTTPLFYQWYFNTNTALLNQTNASLSLPNVSTNDVGGYSVTISNSSGMTNSRVAQLTINTNAPLDFSAIGFCNNGGPITGGAAGPTVYVGSEAQLQSYSDVTAPYTIIITNSFNLTSMDTHVRNNKTLIGSNHVVLSGGGLYLHTATNVIIRNLTITGSSEDGIGLHFSKNVWIDHCTITDSSDGALDITQQSDNITVSWCHFYYSSPSLSHRLASLIASSDSDTGDYRVTYHHNWWGTNVQERMPSNRFGRVHVFNNYYNAPGNNYCVRTRIDAESLIENNWFENVKNPWEVYLTSGTPGKVFVSGNTLVNTTFVGNGSDVIIPSGNDPVFDPSLTYSYALENAATIPNTVTNNAGANRGLFAP